MFELLEIRFFRRAGLKDTFPAISGTNGLCQDVQIRIPVHDVFVGKWPLCVNCQCVTAFFHSITHPQNAAVCLAGEAPIVAADGRSLARALRVAGRVEPVFVDAITDMPQAVLNNARDGDVVICMGAGSIGAVPAKVVEMGGAS